MWGVPKEWLHERFRLCQKDEYEDFRKQVILHGGKDMPSFEESNKPPEQYDFKNVKTVRKNK